MVKIIVGQYTFILMGMVPHGVVMAYQSTMILHRVNIWSFGCCPQDPAPSILIGRPCYHGFSHDANCHSLLWTNQRYSEEVVSTMSEALNTVLKNAGEPEVVLIGYSGGGALAQLLAERIKKTRAVITLAGNIDSSAWAQLHGYSPLDGSFNPAERPPLPSHTLQIHYVGRSDKNIPAHLVESYVSKKNRGEIIVLEQVDHYNGWLKHWPGILLDLNRRLATQ